MNTIEEAKRLHKLIESFEKDPLKKFVAQIDADKLAEIRQENLKKLFAEARKFGLKYIHIGADEICGCENISQPGSPWPAIWKIAEKVGFPGLCGNSDQYQCHEASLVFPPESYGGWDLVENRKLSEEETNEKKFRKVVELFRKPRK
jgi:hypothetical protein